MTEHNAMKGKRKKIKTLKNSFLTTGVMQDGPFPKWDVSLLMIN